MRRVRICSCVSGTNLKIVHRLWIGSMILLEWLQARANRVELEYISMVLLKACCAPAVILTEKSINYASASKYFIPVSFIQNDNFMSSRRQSHFFLGKHFNILTYDINAPFIGCVQFQDGVRIFAAKQFMRQTQNARRLANARGSLNWKKIKIKISSCMNRRITEIIIFGIFPCLAIMQSRSIVSSFPTISVNTCGRYFSILQEKSHKYHWLKFKLINKYQGSSIVLEVVAPVGASNMTMSSSSPWMVIFLKTRQPHDGLGKPCRNRRRFASV